MFATWKYNQANGFELGTQSESLSEPSIWEEKIHSFH